MTTQATIEGVKCNHYNLDIYDDNVLTPSQYFDRGAWIDYIQVWQDAATDLEIVLLNPNGYNYRLAYYAAAQYEQIPGTVPVPATDQCIQRGMFYIPPGSGIQAIGGIGTTVIRMRIFAWVPVD